MISGIFIPSKGSRRFVSTGVSFGPTLLSIVSWCHSGLSTFIAAIALFFIWLDQYPKPKASRRNGSKKRYLGYVALPCETDSRTGRSSSPPHLRQAKSPAGLTRPHLLHFEFFMILRPSEIRIAVSRSQMSLRRAGKNSAWNTSIIQSLKSHNSRNLASEFETSGKAGAKPHITERSANFPDSAQRGVGR